MNNKMIDELKLAITPAVTLCQACSSVWQFILSKTENDRVDYLKIFLTGFKSAEDIAEKPSECFFGVEWKNKQEEAELTDLENRIVSNLIGSSMEESAFYAALCTKLSDDTLLSTLEDKAKFLALLWMDPRIPYYKLDKGRIMSNGFEQVFILQNTRNLSVSDVFETYTYRVGMVGGRYSFATTVGLFTSVVSIIFLLASNKLANALGEEGIW